MKGNVYEKQPIIRIFILKKACWPVCMSTPEINRKNKKETKGPFFYFPIIEITVQ